MTEVLIAIWSVIVITATFLLVPAVRRRSTWAAPFRIAGGWAAEMKRRRVAAGVAKALRPVVRKSEPLCQQCGGIMEKKVHGQASCAGQIFGVIVFVLGVVVTFCLPLIGLIIGPLMCLAALFMGYRQSRVWRCLSCRAMVPRG